MKTLISSHTRNAFPDDERSSRTTAFILGMHFSHSSCLKFRKKYTANISYLPTMLVGAFQGVGSSHSYFGHVTSRHTDEFSKDFCTCHTIKLLAQLFH